MSDIDPRTVIHQLEAFSKSTEVGAPTTAELHELASDAAVLLREAHGFSNSPPSFYTGELMVFDLETTGVDFFKDRIVTAYIGVIDARGEVQHSRSVLIDPEIPIPESASAVHGITDEKAQAEGVSPAKGLRQIVKALAKHDLPIVAFNARYDLTMLTAEARRHGVSIPTTVLTRPVVDGFVIDKALDKYRPGPRTLSHVAARYRVTLDDAHNASADAIAAGRIAQVLFARFGSYLNMPFPDLHKRQAVWAKEQADSFTAYKRRTEPGFPAAPAEWPFVTLPAVEDTNLE